MKVNLAYGQGQLVVDLPDQRTTVIEPGHTPGLADERSAVITALENPIGCRPLKDWIKPTDRVCIGFTDITRATPNHRIIPWLLQHLAHVPREQITLVNSLGTHRPNTREELEKLHKEEKSIEGKIVSRIKGGMMVDIGVKAFLPGSQIDLHPVRDLDGLVGKTFPLKIIKINHRRGNVVVSRRVLLEETRDKKRQTTLATLKEGQLIQGTVKNITDYGSFIDLGGIDGLLHITDMSWGRVGHPSELFTVGDKVEVTVLKYDRETGRISLGLKQKSADPWTNVAGKYPIGTRVRGRVVSLTDYGAFVELEPGVEGLVHVSEMSWTRHVRHPSKVVNIGDIISHPAFKNGGEVTREKLIEAGLVRDASRDLKVLGSLGKGQTGVKGKLPPPLASPALGGVHQRQSEAQT